MTVSSSQTSPKSLCGWAPPWTLTTCGQVFNDDRNIFKKRNLFVFYLFIYLFVCLYINLKVNDVLCITGNDVYFECDVRANPVPHKLIWLHNVSVRICNCICVCICISFLYLSYMTAVLNVLDLLLLYWQLCPVFNLSLCPIKNKIYLFLFGVLEL